MKTKEKVESKKGKKLKIVLLVIAAIVIVAVAFINLTTLPKYDDDKNVIYVGSMVKSKTIDYKDKSGEGLTKILLLKLCKWFGVFVTAVIKASTQSKIHQKILKL